MKFIDLVWCLVFFIIGFWAGNLPPRQPAVIPVVIHKHYTYPRQPDECGCRTDSECEGIEDAECEE